MKTQTFILLSALLLATVSQAAPITLTNKEGKKIEAELVRLDGEKVFLKLTNLSTVEVPLNTLSDADVTQIKAWWEENKNKVGAKNLRFSILKNVKQIDRKVTKTGGSGHSGKNQVAQVVKKMTKDEVTFNCVLKSYAKNDISEITAEYTIYKRVSTRDKDGLKSDVDEIDGTKEIRFIEAMGTADFETDKVPCEDISESGGNKPTTRKSETVEGIIVTLSVGGEVFLKQSYPENYIGRLEEKEKRDESE